jgi:hypothetical protein
LGQWLVTALPTNSAKQTNRRMKQLGILIALAASSTAIAAPAPDLSPITTSKSVPQFGGCFVAAQERAGLAWSYVPKPHGGTFSNLGAIGAQSSYFLAISDRGNARELRLEAADAAGRVDLNVARAVSQCA